jgi:hypothetical protein
MLRRRPILRTAATTAVIAGTATAVSGRVARHQNDKAQQQAEAQAYQQQAAAPPPPAPAPAPAPAAAAAPQLTAVEQLTQLAQLKEQGILTEAEFEAEKAKILAG